MVRKLLFEKQLQRALENRLDAADRAAFAESYAGTANDTPRISLRSLPPRDETEDIELTAGHSIQTRDGEVDVTGNALLCRCPNCQSPMTVRVWLELADCWQCETSIQLSIEQIAAASRLGDAVSNAIAPEPQSLLPDVPVDDDYSDEPVVSVSLPEDNVDDELYQLTEASRAARLLRRGLSMFPAWLISALLHLFLLLILALIVFSNSEVGPTITLSSFIAPDKAEGGEIRIADIKDVLVDDLQMAAEMDIGAEEIRDVIQQAQKDAQDLVVDKNPTMPLPDIENVKNNITTRRDQLMSFAARDPRVRSEIVQKAGGTTLTEAAVARGLRWLASVQNEDGSWSLDDYDPRTSRDREGDAAATSLAMLPFLGAGQTHEYGKYKHVVAKGLRWMMEKQLENGDLRANFPGQAGMYAHGQATIVLCEALAMTGDEQLRLPAQRAIDFIEAAQHEHGGWRYRPGQEGDTSMLGWHLMALQSARAPNVGLRVDPNTLQMADYYLDQAMYRRPVRGQTLPKGALYTYQPGEGRPTAPMTAEAMLCRMYLGWKRNDPRLKSSINWLAKNYLPSAREKNIYYWYYGTQVMHHYGGKPWEKWNKEMRELLVTTQEKRGWRAGSWSPRGYRWGAQGGRIYVTSLAVCTLEIYYRHLPVYAPIELD